MLDQRDGHIVGSPRGRSLAFALEVPREKRGSNMPDNNEIPEVLRLVLNDAKRKRSPEEEETATRFALGRATVAKYIAARRQGMAR